MTEMIEARPLKQALLNHYGHFADQRIKSLDRGILFIVDDRGSGDHGADRKLFLWFCTIFAEVVDANTVKVSLRGGVPKGTGVSAWIQKYAVAASDGSLVFNVTPNDIAKLGELASAFRSIVRPGAPRYTEKAYKFVCPRAAAALDQLSKVLAGHWV
jgi:hypothetical protein